MEDPKKTQRRGKSDWFLLSLLALSLTMNVILAVGVLRLSALPAVNASSRPTGPAKGTVLPALDAERLDGSRELIGFQSAERPTLLYVFTPSCKWCERNLPNLTALTLHARAKYRIIGLSLDPAVSEYVQRAKLDFPVYINPSPATVREYGMGSTPQTLVISTKGEVLHAWSGAYIGTTQREVEGVFELSLPGLAR